MSVANIRPAARPVSSALLSFNQSIQASRWRMADHRFTNCLPRAVA
jgi:hypothetical protein